MAVSDVHKVKLGGGGFDARVGKWAGKWAGSMRGYRILDMYAGWRHTHHVVAMMNG